MNLKYRKTPKEIRYLEKIDKIIKEAKNKDYIALQ